MEIVAERCNEGNLQGSVSAALFFSITICSMGIFKFDWTRCLKCYIKNWLKYLKCYVKHMSAQLIWVQQRVPQDKLNVILWHTRVLWWMRVYLFGGYIIKFYTMVVFLGGGIQSWKSMCMVPCAVLYYIYSVSTVPSSGGAYQIKYLASQLSGYLSWMRRWFSQFSWPTSKRNTHKRYELIGNMYHMSEKLH